SQKVLQNIIAKREKVLQNIIAQREIEIIRHAMDLNNPTTRKFAVKLAQKYPGDYNLNQVCAIWNFCKQNWKYVSDPRGINYVAKASESIELGLSGDS
ncbi:MAG: hypothetical protein NZ551_11810, partial [Microscillaceae bacterium]|nr:hypothetical protein [Microscillaceae bacterium]MDW8461880.1 hypothetical protein [Cytophagales bacterium]